MTISNVVKKEFIGVNGVQRVSDLITIYDLLKQKGVPHVDTLNSFNLNNDHSCVYLSPVGIEVFPVSGSEAFSAVVCVLKALKVRYDVSVFII
jgi:hypothetical protein